MLDAPHQADVRLTQALHVERLDKIDMATQINLQNRISELFSEKLNLDPPPADAELLEMGIIDSLTFVDLLLCLEQEFGTQISIEDLEIDNFGSIKKIAEFVFNYRELREASNLN